MWVNRLRAFLLGLTVGVFIFAALLVPVNMPASTILFLLGFLFAALFMLSELLIK